MSDKQKRLNELYGEYKEVFEEKEIVLGDGNPESQLLLIGEAPGKDEVRLLKPFVGMAGRNLNEFLKILEIDRDAIYVSNAIKYRLSKVNPKTERIINRPATQDEIRKNREYLFREIAIIQPKYIITLGNVPLQAITDDSKIRIGDVHGQMMEIHIEKSSYILFPLYHPASIIYNQQLKGVYLDDLKKLKELLKD